MGERPTGTVTFLFTDIEASTRQWEAHPEAMRVALARHDEAVRAAITAQEGYIFSTGGDGFGVSFARAAQAVTAAQAAQLALAEIDWPDGVHIRARMGVHTGEVHERDGDYFGPAVNRAARIMSAAHGGQVVLSSATAEIVEQTDLVDVGTHRLRDLGEPQHLFQLGRGEFPPLRVVDSYATNLPTELDSFVGRADEIIDIAVRLRAHRLVTLTGVGGVGKTRLALQVAADLLPQYEHGCWLVELASVADPLAVPSVIAAALRVPERGGEPPIDTIVRHLRPQARLVVLDNCEHVLDAAADAAAVLMRECPSVRVLATSREGLAVRGEQLVPVPSLRDEARALFYERAEAQRPGLTASTDTAVVDQLCARLDGVPLAIELAAARARSMSPAEILQRLDQRFRLLRGGRRGAERHQTIQGAIEWSYELLEPGDRTVFNRLGVFAGPFDLAAAEAIAGADLVDPLDVADHLDSLVGKSMVQIDSIGDTTRYRLLETLRHFAVDQLNQAAGDQTLRDRHAAYFARRAREWGRWATGEQQAAAVQKIAGVLPDLRAALEWLLETGDIESASRLVRAMGTFAALRSPKEHFRNLAEVIDRSEGLRPASRVALLAWGAWQANDTGQPHQAIAWGRAADSLIAAHDLPFPAALAYGLGNALAQIGEREQAIDVAERGLAAAEKAGDGYLGSIVCGALATAWLPLDAERARAYAAQSFALAEAIGNPLATGSAHVVSGFTALAGDATAALAHGQSAISSALDIGDMHIDCAGHTIVAAALSQLDRPHEAVPHVLAATDYISEWGDYEQSEYALTAAAACLAISDPLHAAHLVGAALSVSRRTGGRRWMAPTFERLARDALAPYLDAEALEAAIDEGRALGLEAAVQLVHALAAEVATQP